MKRPIPDLEAMIRRRQRELGAIDKDSYEAWHNRWIALELAWSRVRLIVASLVIVIVFFGILYLRS